MEEKNRVKMIPKHKPSRHAPAPNSSSESDHQPNHFRRRPPPPNQSPTHDPARGGPPSGPFLSSYLKSQHPLNQVPSRRDGTKTDAPRGGHEEGEGPRGGSLSPREVFVRETRASRLRAASRTPPALSDAHSASPKPWKDRTLISNSPTESSSTSKDVDKSHSRKSHLNRSHTSEGVYHTVTGVSNVRRRRPKNLSLESSPVKTNDKSTSSRPIMGNANGTATDLTPIRTLPNAHHPLPKTTPLKPYPAKPTDNRSKNIDIATRAQILAASTLKMINRLDEINSKTRRMDDAIRKSCPATNSEKGASMDGAGRSVPKDSPNLPKQPSILKNKPSPSWDFPKPVSILKRKSLSQDDPQWSPPPVTFSPSVLSKESDSKKQGILKKRRSLDENEVMRRRSYSPDATCDFKSILKTQRRSSMEELTRRSHSPDSAPQGILKRKSSKEEDAEEEPQGILKRKSLPCLVPQHVKISETSSGDAPENVRPILKKKSSSEEHSASEPSLTEVPKSILKKKTSAEADEPEDKPMRPILKGSRAASLEDTEEGRRGRAGAEEPKPILKREKGAEEGVVVRRREGNRQERAHSSPDMDSELRAIFVKRRSLEFRPVCGLNLGAELQRAKKASSNERLKGGVFLSVAEKITNLENFLEVERMERERRNSPPGSPPCKQEGVEKMDGEKGMSVPSGLLGDSERSEGPKEEQQTEDIAPNPHDAVQTKMPRQLPLPELRYLRSPHLPLPSDEFARGKAQKGTPTEPPEQNQQRLTTDRKASLDNRVDEKLSSYLTSSPLKSPNSNDIDSESESVISLKSTRSDARQNDSRTSVLSSDWGEVLSPSSDGKLAERDDTECYFSVDSCGDKISSLSLIETSDADAMESEDLLLLRRSGSVSAKTSLFKEMESKSRDDAAAGEKTKRAPKENAAICRRREKKLLESYGQRHHTQPVSTEEVELAVRHSRSNSEDKRGEDAKNHEDELCTMSYKDRLKLFESTLSAKLPNWQELPRKRSARHKTQPVTTDEVETAKSQKSSTAATEAADNRSGGSSPRSEDKGRPKGILKKLNQSNEEKRVVQKAEKEMRWELKGILKQPSAEKRGTSSSEEESGREEEETSVRPRSGSLGANLAALLQRVEPVEKEKRREEKKKEEETKVMPKYMKNEGLARIINRTRNSSLIVKSQSHSSVSSAFQPPAKCALPDPPPALNGEDRKPRSDETDDGRFPCGLRRSTTQPLGPSEESTDDDMSGATIQERLARLKRSGELDWQKRKCHNSNLEGELSVITAGNYLLNEQIHLRNQQRPKDTQEFRNSSSILADRLGKLDAAKEGWKKRVPPSDALRFSVEGRMLEKRDSLSPPNRTPLPSRKGRSPKAARFRSREAKTSGEAATNPLSRLSAPRKGEEGMAEVVKEGAVVRVPRMDDETFTSFFEGLKSMGGVVEERVEIKDEDLDAVTRMKSSQLLVQRRNIKTQKRTATVKNPVKALAARLDLQEYTQTIVTAPDKELKRLRIERAAATSTLAIEALAGLASREDFTAVSLKKPTDVASPDAPYKPLMLLQVKGRRHVQTRLVEPVAESVNAGDCFILIAPDRLFHFIGEFANVIEKSRGSEICAHIHQTGDLGCSANGVITIGEGGRASEEQVDEFWRLLGGDRHSLQPPGDVDEDELFESALVDTNMVYELVGEELVPVDAYWGGIPKIEVLNPNKVLVLDFGSELYVWNGKNVSLQERKIALKVAKELWEEGFDYSECDLCPLKPSSRWNDTPVREKSSPVRPPWALFAKITQNMETVLFREKFLDWPDYSRVGTRGVITPESREPTNIKACDPKAMLENELPEADLVLEGCHLGRGVSYFDEETRRCSEISTKDVRVWHVREFEYEEVPRGSLGQFHMGDSYVVRWHYVITITGRELTGQPSKHLTTGRNRYAYFFWQGQESPMNDKGAAACITVELDKEHGPQVRVVQGSEPAAFLSLFGGRMVVHRGRRCSDAPLPEVRLFLCRGEMESEAVLLEMGCSMRQLRSAASFVLVNRTSGEVIVWHGCKSPDHCRKLALSAAKRLRPDIREFQITARELTITEEAEGAESRRFLTALGGDNRQLYHSLLQEDLPLCTPRLFHLSAVSGEFLATEVCSPLARRGALCPLAFLQSDLYAGSQPGLYLLDCSAGVWLWQGWWEEGEEGREGREVRFQAERRAAMETALGYWRCKYGTGAAKAYLVWAGLEPLVFVNQFPFWTDRDDVAELNMKEGRKPGESVPIAAELSTLTKATYPLGQLLHRPLPPGVNPSSLEDYLQAECFPELFAMEKEEFLNLPSWKKKKLKQEAGLF